MSSVTAEALLLIATAFLLIIHSRDPQLCRVFVHEISYVALFLQSGFIGVAEDSINADFLRNPETGTGCGHSVVD